MSSQAVLILVSAFAIAGRHAMDAKTAVQASAARRFTLRRARGIDVLIVGMNFPSPMRSINLI